MKPVLILSGALAVATVLRGVWRTRRTLSQTTLISAWRWSIVAIAGLIAVWLLTVVQYVDPVLLNQLWYAVGLLLLCPPIAVLGARRPGTGVWSTFVILPLLAVLGWPLLTVWAGAQELRPLYLETPALLGFALVLVMGAGNYLGTRFSLAAAAYGVSACLIVGPISTVAPTELQSSLTARLVATIILGVSTALAATSQGSTARHVTPFDRLWEDYRDMFGIVWAQRFQDRLNGVAQQQSWPVKLDQTGFHWNDGTTPQVREEISSKIEQTMRWLLRRFVDPEWIDARLSGGEVCDTDPASTIAG